jgi:Ca2+-binding EF-hand superfamily protein
MNLVSIKTVPVLLAACLLATGCQTTPTQTVDAAAVFAKADVDGDGKLSPKEANDILIARMFALYDTDGGEAITATEWSRHHATMETFHRYDANRDGVLTLAEVQRQTYQEKVFIDLFKEADRNKDGFITLEELESFQREFHAAGRG